jgi:hypothetical protein
MKQEKACILHILYVYEFKLIKTVLFWFKNSDYYLLLTNGNVTHFIFNFFDIIKPNILTDCLWSIRYISCCCLFVSYIYLYLKTVQNVSTCHSASSSIFYDVIILIDGNEVGMSYCFIMYSNIVKIKARTI